MGDAVAEVVEGMGGGVTLGVFQDAFYGDEGSGENIRTSFGKVRNGEPFM